MTKNIIGIAIALVVLLGVVWISKPNPEDNKETASVSSASEGLLFVEDASSYDFGTISMAEGDVSHAFKIKNTGSEAVVINKMYTSCMCTTAILNSSGKKFG